jgi:hypothetical protein
MSEHTSFERRDSPEDESESGPIGEASPVRSDQIPPGYSLFKRETTLLNGNIEPAFYSTRSDHIPDPSAWERSKDSIVAGFVWALTVPEFADLETLDDDRTQEIGNMIAFALTRGLTEEQVVQCYKIAFNLAKNTQPN